MKRDFTKKEKFWVENALVEVASRHLTRTECMVYVVLCRRANKDQECWPSAHDIAAKLNIGDRQARRAIDQLIERGMIQETTRKGRTSVFTLLDSSCWRLPPGECASVDTSVSPTPLTLVSTPDMGVKGTPDTGVNPTPDMGVQDPRHRCQPKEVQKEAQGKEAQMRSKNKPSPRGKRTGPTHPDLRAATDHALCTFTDRNGKPIWNARDYSAIAKLFCEVPGLTLEAFKVRWAAFLGSDDRFYSPNRAHALAWFCGQWDAFARGPQLKAAPGATDTGLDGLAERTWWALLGYCRQVTQAQQDEFVKLHIHPLKCGDTLVKVIEAIGGIEAVKATPKEKIPFLRRDFLASFKAIHPAEPGPQPRTEPETANAA